jgi:hypothetical protein
VVRRQIEFDQLTRREFNKALRSGAGLHNIYRLEDQPEKALEEAIYKAIFRKSSEDDTHPSPRTGSGWSVGSSTRKNRLLRVQRGICLQIVRR